MIARLQAAFYKSGLLAEFLDTLITDEEIPHILRKRVWAMVSTEWDRVDDVTEHLATDFNQSTDEADLTEKWTTTVNAYWLSFPDCPMKKELANGAA